MSFEEFLVHRRKKLLPAPYRPGKTRRSFSKAALPDFAPALSATALIEEVYQATALVTEYFSATALTTETFSAKALIKA
jgi:hypothetical protein